MTSPGSPDFDPPGTNNSSYEGSPPEGDFSAGENTPMTLEEALAETEALKARIAALEEEAARERDQAGRYRERITFLETVADIDTLTGLLTRRRGDAVYKGLTEARIRLRAYELESGYKPAYEEESHSVLFIDLDWFKRFNDLQDHPFGDMVLRTVGHLIRQTIRSSDAPVRYGGEEMLVIAPRTKLDDALKPAQKILQAARELRFDHEKTELQQVSLSIGIGRLLVGDEPGYEPNEGDEGLSIGVKEADEAMYAAKEAGRDCIAIPDGKGGFVIHTFRDAT